MFSNVGENFNRISQMLRVNPVALTRITVTNNVYNIVKLYTRMLRSNTGTYTVEKPPAWLEYVRDEHIHTRTKVSLFDVSSFAKLHVQGKDALSAMQRLCCADVSDLNRAVYVVSVRARSARIQLLFLK